MRISDWSSDVCSSDLATEVEIRFEAVGDETRVTVEHRGWDAIQQRHAARHGFELMLFQRRLGEHWRPMLPRMGEISANIDLGAGHRQRFDVAHPLGPAPFR